MADTDLEVRARLRDGVSAPLKNIESTVIRTVGAISAALAGIAVIGFPISFAVEFQKQMLNVRKTTNLSYDAIRLLSKELVDLSTQTNKSATELAKMAEMGGRMGMADKGVDTLVAFVKEVSILSTALDMSAEEVSMGMGKLSNLFGLTMDTFGKAGAVINQLDNESTANASELFDIMRRMGDLGGAVSFDQAAALAATAIDLGATAEVAGTTYTKIYANMRSEAGKFAAFMQMSTEDWVGLVDRDGVGALKAFVSQLNKVPTEVAASTKEALTGGGRIFEFVTKLQKQIAKGPNSILDSRLASAVSARDLGTSAINEQASVLSGLSAQWEVFKNRIGAISLAVGEKALYGLTKVLIALGDTLSKPETVNTFVGAMNGLISVLGSLVDILSTLTTGMSFPWAEVLQIGALMIAIKAVGLLRNSLLSLPTKVANVAGFGATTTTGADKTKKEQQATTALRTAYDAYVEKKKEAKVLQDNLLTAALKNVQAEQALAQATTARNDAAKKVQVTKRIQSSANGELAAATLAQTQANAYLAQREQQHLQQQLQLEQKFQAEKKAIKGKGMMAARAVLTEQYALDLAALEQKQAAERRGYQRHYSNLSALAAQRLDRANTRVATSEAAVARALSSANGAGAALIDATATKQSTEAALKEAERTIANSTLWATTKRRASELNTSFRGMFNGTGQSAFAKAMADLLGTSVRYSASTSISAQMTTRLSGAFRVAGLAATAAARGIHLLASAGLRLLGWVGIAVMVYDIGKAMLSTFGLIDPLINGINSLVQTVNRLTGLKLPTISTKADDDAIAASNAARIKGIEDAAAAAEAFSKTFGGVNFSKGADAALKDLKAIENKLSEVATKTKEGVSLDMFSDRSAVDALVNGLDTMVKINKQMEYLNAARGSEFDKVYAVNAELLKQTQTVAALRKQMAEYEAATAASTGNADSEGNRAVTERRNAELLVMKTRLTEEERKQNVLIADYNNAAQRRSLMDAEQVMLARKFDDILQATIAGLPEGAFTDLFGNWKEADALISQIQKAAAALADVTAKKNAITERTNLAGAGNSTTPSMLRELEDVSRAAEEAAGVYDRLTQKAINSSSLRGLGTKEERAAIISNIASMGTLTRMYSSLDTIAKRTGGTVQSLFKGTAAIPTNGGTAYTALLGQVVMAKNAKDAYGQLAKAAAAAAEAAKTAVTKALERSKIDIANLRDSAIAAEAQLKQNIANAKATAAGKEIDAGSAKKLLELDIEKQKELDIINLLREQGQISEANYQRRKLDIDQSYSKKSDSITDAAGDEKAKVAGAQQVKAFEEARAKVQELQQSLESMSAKMQNTALPPAERAALIEPFREAMTQVEAYIAAMQKAKEAIRSTPTSKGLDPVPQGTIDGMQKILEIETKRKNAANQSAAGAQQPLLESIASQTTQGVQHFKALEEKGIAALKAIAEASGTSLGKVSEDLATLANTETFTALKKNFEEMAAAGTLAVGSVSFNTEDWKAKIAEARQSAADIFKGVEITTDLGKLDASLTASAEAFATTLRGKVDEVGASGVEIAGKVTVDMAVARQAVKEATDKDGAVDIAGKVSVPTTTAGDISKGVGTVDIAARAVVTEVVGADGTVTKTSNKIQVPGFKEGGPIIGAGNGTSDSILMRGAHGEYMIDALTTRTFGSGFFATLQSIAKSGRPASALLSMLPGIGAFETPSFVSDMSAVGAGGSETVATQAIDISFNGRKAGKVMGSRDTINNLVSALQDVARSTN